MVIDLFGYNPTLDPSKNLCILICQHLFLMSSLAKETALTSPALTIAITVAGLAQWA